MTQFDPEHHGFVRLRDFQFTGGVAVFEYRNHAAIDGTPDFLRLNIYLSKDGDFVCIWHGLLEPAIAESALCESPLPPDYDFGGAYTTELFRGYLEADDTASVVLKLLRIGAAGYSVHHLRIDTTDGLRCDALTDAHWHSTRKA